jgi:hypothetical protein
MVWLYGGTVLSCQHGAKVWLLYQFVAGLYNYCMFCVSTPAVRLPRVC